jgi:hypothetical protein
MTIGFQTVREGFLVGQDEGKTKLKKHITWRRWQINAGEASAGPVQENISEKADGAAHGKSDTY